MDSVIGETTDFLTGSATERGQPVTPAMLKQWRDAGLLPRPAQRPLGKGKGTVTIYPAGTSALLRRLLDIRSEEVAAGQRFDREAAFWRLWWEGWPVNFQQLKKRLEATRASWKQALTAFADDDDCLVIEAFQTDRLPALLARTRKRVGVSRMDTVAALILGSLSGDSPEQWQDADDAPTLLTALGLDGAVRSLGPDAPRFSADIAETMNRFGQAMAPDALQVALRQATRDDIDQARTDLRSIIEASRIMWEVAGVLLSASGNASNSGKDLFAVREKDGLDLLPATTLSMLALRRNPIYAQLLDAMQSASAMVRAIRAQQQTDK